MINGMPVEDSYEYESQQWDSDEIPATERDLADDAPWKQIQKNTFTRWCNEHLKVANMRLNDLGSDLSDGLRLIALVEVLSQKHVGKFNKRPTFRQMKMENVALALEFLECERIRLVSIDAQAIVDGNLKLILGLIWTLILHYSISMPMWEGEEEGAQDLTPKQRLLGWIQNKIPQIPITNFSRDWQDGRALGALVDNCAPGLCPDWEEWGPDGQRNADEAMALAEKYLGVAKVIAPEEITNPHVDDQSVMTYLSQFPNAKLVKNAPLRNKTDPKKARAYGKGVTATGNKVGEPAPFTVDTASAGSGDVLVYVQDPAGHTEEVAAVANNDKNKTFSVVYHPQLPGKHQVTVLFSGKDINKSPFVVDVDDSPPCPDQVIAKGPGLEASGNTVSRETHFEVFTAGCGIGELEVVIVDPNGAPSVVPDVFATGPGSFSVKYIPQQQGPHQVHILFGGGHIRNSPFNVQIDLPFNPLAAWAEGPGLAPEGLIVRDQAAFVVHTEEAGSGQLDIRIIGPRGISEPVNIVDNGDGTYTCDYVPLKAGQYNVTISFGGKAINGSPYVVIVDPAPDAGAVRLSGPGLQPGNIAGNQAWFELDFANAGKGEPFVEVIGPNGQEVPIQVEELENGKLRVSYEPQEKGIYQVNATFADVLCPGCPLVVDILPAFDASSCRAYGRGLQPRGVRVSEKADFYINTTGAGEADLKVNIIGPKGNPEPVEMHQDPNGSEYSCAYYPRREGKYQISITFGGQDIAKSPFVVFVGAEAGTQQVRAFGPGLHGGMVGHTADFVVESIGDHVGQLSFSIEGPSHAQIECEDKQDGSCDVRYFPTEAGEYAVHVICDDEDIKDSPFMALIQQNDPRLKAAQCTAYGPGLETGVPVVGQPAEFTVDARGAGMDAPLKIYAKDSEGNDIPVQIVDNNDGTYTCIYIPEKSAKHTIIVSIGGINIPKSPWRVLVQEDSRPENVRVYGPGVEPNGLKADEPTYFTVDCTDAGLGDVSIGIKSAPGVTGATDEDMDFDIIKNDNDTFTVRWHPPSAGVYTIQVLFADQEIPGAPIDVSVSPNHDASKVVADGPGLLPKGVEAEKPTNFTIYARGAGKGNPEVAIVDAQGQPIAEAVVTPNGDGSFTVQYCPTADGPAQVHVSYGGDTVPNSPFNINVAPALNISMVQVHSMLESCFVREEQTFEVYTTGAGGQGQLTCKITSPSRKQIYCQMHETENGYEISFTPSEEGTYRIDIEYDRIPINGSPFHIEAQLPPDPTKVKAHGSGLTRGEVGEPAAFSINTQGAGNGSLGLTVEGPCEAKIDCIDNGDGSCSVTYLPTEPGTYQINILFAEEHIPGSPFSAFVKPSFDASKVIASGDGLEEAKVSEVSTFQINTTKAGKGEIFVEVIQSDGSQLKVDLTSRDGIYTASYVPTKPGQAVVNLSMGGEMVDNFPRAVNVKPKIDTSSIRVFGPGVDGVSPVFVDVEAEFTIDCRRVAPQGGDFIDASITGPSGIPSAVRLTDNHDGTYSARYIAYERGEHNLSVLFQEVPVPHQPFSVNVTDGCDAQRVKAYGPGLERGTTRQAALFTVDTRGAGTGGMGLAIEGPSDAKIRCVDNKDGTCTVEYFPEQPGEYEIFITYGGEAIPGSPYSVLVSDKVDPSAVRVSGNGIENNVRANIKSDFTIDCTQAGVAPLETTVRGPSGHTRVEMIEKSSQIYQACYTAQEVGIHEVTVKYAGETVPETPRRVNVLPQFEADKVKASGAGLNNQGVPASIPVEFTIDATDAGEGHLSVRITDPEGNDKKASINDNQDGTFTVKYVPDMVGRYTIDICYGGDGIPNTPFPVRAVKFGDANRCTVSGLGVQERIQVNKEVSCSVNTAQAGTAKVTGSVIAPSGQFVECDVFENGDSTFDVFYTATEVGEHQVNLRYGGQHIKGSPFYVSAEQLGVTGSLYPANDFRQFDMRLPVHYESQVTGLVTMPSGATCPPQIIDNGDGTCTVKYQPTEAGLHEMAIYQNGVHINGSPLNFYVDAYESGHVTAYGPGLSFGRCNEPCSFTIVTERAGAGNLALSCEGPSKAEFSCVDNKDGTCSVEYLPTAPGEYKIHVKFADEHIAGSPFMAHVTAGANAQASYGSLSEIPLLLNESDLNQLECTLQAPNGKEEPVKLRYLSNGGVGICFTPKQVGEHLIFVKKRGKDVQNSPFRVFVSQSEVGDAGKVKVYGPGVGKNVGTMEMTEFFVDTKNAGYGGLALSVEGPSKVDINCEDREDNECRVTYMPQEPGVYQINVKFADRHVTGSPFTVRADGQGKLKESVVRHRKAAQAAQVGNTCDLNLKIPNMSVADLTASVLSPSKKTEEAQIIETEESNYSIRFVPRETGIHTVNVLYRGNHVPGSPFNFTVGELTSGGANKVTATGPGLERALINIPAEFSIWTHEAGAGGLSIAVEGPSKAEINFEDRKDGSCGVHYLVSQPGDYEVCVKFNEDHITGSPFPVTISDGGPPKSDASKVRASGKGLVAPKMGPENEFHVNADSAGKNVLMVGIIGPNSPCEEVMIKHLGQREYNVTYTVLEAGDYVLVVKWGDEHIPGSPFHVNVP